MKRTVPAVFCLTVAFIGGYFYGRDRGRETVVSADSGRRALYYRCPMHPAYHADHPGLSPCCHMALEPVYADDAREPASAAIRVTPRQQELIGVQYGTVEYAPAARTARGAARVSVNEARTVRIQTKLEGFIDQLFVRSVGERVKKGQRLVSVYNRRAYSMAQSDFLQATMDASGMTLSAAAAASPDARNAARQAVLAAREHLEMLGFTEDQIEAVARAHQPLRSFPLYAPIDGVVIEFDARVNQQIAMEPLMTIADLSTVWVTASFSSADAAQVHPHDRATLTLASVPGREFAGTVDQVLPKFDSETHTAKVRLVFDNPQLVLQPEMIGEVEVHTNTGERKLTVAETAVVDSGRSRTVFVDLGNGYLEPRAVTTGERFGGRIEILSGLAAGQRVVTSANFLLDSETQLRQTR